MTQTTKARRIADCKHDACERRAQQMSAERVAKGKPPITEMMMHLPAFDAPKPAPQVVAEFECQTCALYDGRVPFNPSIRKPLRFSAKFLSAHRGHDVREVGK